LSPTNLYHLREGINIIYLDRSARLEIFRGSSKEDNLIFGNLDLIKKATNETETTKAVHSINPKLDYKGTTSATELEENILKDLRNLDPKYLFYYNNYVSNSSLIDLNDLDEKDILSYYTN
jgi:hypothetical protein